MIDLTRTDYVEWNVKSVIKIIDRGKYAYRVVLVYGDGTKVTKQHSGFATKKAAEEARNLTIGELANGTYIVNDKVKLEELLDYWLEYEVRQRAGSSNTYLSYANAAHKHIIPFLGKKRLTELNKGDIYRLYEDRAGFSKHIVRLVKTVMNTALRYAVTKRLLAVNVAEGVNLPKTVEPKSYHTRKIDTAKTLTMEQIQMLLEASRDTPIHMQVLFNVLMGLRKQEINGLKYSDVDYIKRTLTVSRQLGKELNREPYGFNKGGSAKTELPVKTASSERVLPIPDRVFEAILHEREVYEKNRRRRRKVFQDDGYICCSTYGKPRSKDFHWKYYKQLLKDCGLPDIRWHDLRLSYCTLLLKNDFSLKAVSNLMGHSKELITMDVYGDNVNIIPDEIPELVAYMNDILPNREDGKEENTGDEVDVSDIVIDVDAYLNE